MLILYRGLLLISGGAQPLLNAKVRHAMGGGKILAVSYERALLRTRKLLLCSEGYEVSTADSFAAAKNACSNTAFNLVIIGHSIPRSDQKQLTALVRHICRDTPLLLILRSELEECPADVDYTVNAQDGPGVLVRVVNSILRASPGPVKKRA